MRAMISQSQAELVKSTLTSQAETIRSVMASQAEAIRTLTNQHHQQQHGGQNDAQQQQQQQPPPQQHHQQQPAPPQPQQPQQPQPQQQPHQPQQQQQPQQPPNGHPQPPEPLASPQPDLRDLRLGSTNGGPVVDGSLRNPQADPSLRLPNPEVRPPSHQSDLGEALRLQEARMEQALRLHGDPRSSLSSSLPGPLGFSLAPPQHQPQQQSA